MSDRISPHGASGLRERRETEGIEDRPDTTLRVLLASDIDSTDPALGYHLVSWQCEFATQAKLVNYPDEPGDAGAVLVPEVATDLPTVSADHRIYTFAIRTGDDAYRFSTGEVVTARHFAAAITRVLAPEMQSPAAMFMADVAGADDVLAGRAREAEGVRVLPDNRLEIELVAPRPDFLARIAMPFFGAIPLDLPLDSNGVDAFPSAGPYYIARRVRGRSIVIRRNPYYRHSRPCRLGTIVYEVGVDPDEAIERIERGDADYVADGIPPDEEARLGADYGVNKRRFLVAPRLQLDYFAMNTRRKIFGDPRVRRAVNFALDRPTLLRVRGEYAGVVTDHILPPRMGGRHDDGTLFPLDGPDYERARAELPADFEGGTAIVYTADTLAGPDLGYCVQRNLKEIGIDVEVITLAETHMHQLAGRPDEEFDGLLTGWAADYPDPFAFMNILLDGTRIGGANNVNFAYFDDPLYNRKLQEAAELVGEDRYRAYGELDIEISRDAAPWVSYDNRTARDFVSDRVGAFHHPVFGLDLAAVSLE